jgi:hypothetical protein
MTMPATSGRARVPRGRLANEDGTALVIALMSMLLLTALAAAVVMVSSTEVKIAGNYNNGQETLYAADAAVERVVQDLLLIPRWNDILTGAVKSSMVDGSDSTAKNVTGGNTIILCCSATSATGQLQAISDAQDNWGANDPQWKLFAYAPLKDMLPDLEIDSPSYVAVWIADDPAESDDDPTADTNGTLTLHAEAFGPNGAHKVIEVTVARTSGTEIERGQIAQRGQEELNQRSRKAAVQTPGTALTNMEMSVSTGNLSVK